MRSIAVLLVAYCLLMIQSTAIEVAPLPLAVPSFGLLVVLHVGLSSKWSIGAGAVLALCTGYLFDLVAGAPQGLHALVFILMVLAARALSLRVAVRGPVLAGATAFIASLLAGVLVVVVRAQVVPEGGYGGLRQTPIEALLTGAFAPPVLGLLRKVEGRLDPTRSRVGLARGPRSIRDGMVLRRS